MKDVMKILGKAESLGKSLTRRYQFRFS